MYKYIQIYTNTYQKSRNKESKSILGPNTAWWPVVGSPNRRRRHTHWHKDFPDEAKGKQPIQMLLSIKLKLISIKSYEFSNLK